MVTLEHHCLQLPYAPLRLQRHRLVNNLMTSLEEHGQLVPVVVVPSVNNQWILMDGYLRVNALRRLGKDTLAAEVWACDPAEALLTLLTEHQSRAWETIEEALLLQELYTQHGLSQSSIAARMGRDQSWISRRVSLLDGLTEPMRAEIISGKLSLWTATRILVPMARAIPAHAELLLQYLLKQPISTRMLDNFYQHYQRSNQQQRFKMVSDLDLFFKVQASLVKEKQAHQLQAGPEGRWCSQLRSVKHTLTSLIPLAAQVLTPVSDSPEYNEVLKVFNEAKTEFDILTHTIRRLTDAHQRHPTDSNQLEAKGTEHLGNQQAVVTIT
jgi:ParB family chromosome partitioning protein